MRQSSKVPEKKSPISIRRVSKSLKNSEMRYRRLFETAQDGILILDGKSGKIIDANPFLVKMLGYTHSEFLGKQLWEIGLYKDVEENRVAFEELKKNKYIRYEDLPLKSKDGRKREVEFISNSYLVDHEDVIQCNIRDISERKAIEKRVEIQANILGQIGQAVIATDQMGLITYMNIAAEELYGWNLDEVLGRSIIEVTPSQATQAQATEIMDSLSKGQNWAGYFLVQRRDGTIFPAHVADSPIRDEKGNLVGVVGISYDVTESRLAEQRLMQLSSVVEQTADIVIITNQEGIIEYVNHAFEEITGFAKEEAIGKTPRILKSGLHTIKEYETLWKTILAGKIFQGAIINRRKNGNLYYEEKTITPLRNEDGEITHFVSTSKDTTERLQREREQEAVNTVSAALRTVTTLGEMLPLLLEETLNAMHAPEGAIWLYDPIDDELKTAVTRGWGEAGLHSHLSTSEKPGEGINGRVFASGQSFISKEIYQDKKLARDTRKSTPPGIGGATVPIRTREKVIGTFNVNVFLPREITKSEIRLLTTLSEIAGNAIQRTQLHEKTQLDAKRFAALHSIDIAINSSGSLSETLDILLGEVLGLLGVDAAAILLFNPSTLMLEFFSGKGFHTHAIEKSQIHLGEGYAGRVALEHLTLSTTDLRSGSSKSTRAKLLEREAFVSYYGVPLLNKGKVIGVLDIFNRSLITHDPEWLEFMETLASQAAIAIDSANLFKDLQQSNSDLMQAYDSTIEGWSRAMDLRDHETEGHTQRVADLTIQLARAKGLKEEEIMHIRRGALLHDMGKMGIPDSILLKPGPLTKKEWVIMRQHPRFAFDMLSPIDFLRPATDIPYCHHEKWDGSGYPRGLKGEQIPIAARLFAVIDVWDALRSDRPYRKAWSEERVLEHIRSLKGTHFDPKVADLFLNMIAKGSLDTFEYPDPVSMEGVSPHALKKPGRPIQKKLVDKKKKAAE